MKPPLWLPWTLLASIAGRHQAVDVISMAFADTDRARKALFYIAGSLSLILLYVVLVLIAPRRPVGLYAAISSVCAWGILQESQCVVCRIALGIGQRVQAPLWRGLCDVWSGFPVSTLTLGIPVCIAFWWHWQGSRGNG